MNTHIAPTKARREPRLGGDSRATKAQRLSSALPKALKKLASASPTNARTSAALLALKPRADEILDLLQRGYSANAIATALADEDGDDASFSVETIRVAIKRLQAEASARAGRPQGSRAVPTTTRPSAVQAASIVVPQQQTKERSNAAHAAFEDDPQ